MHYELRPGWQRPIERFAAGHELNLARRWAQVSPNPDAGVWRVEDDGRRWGTKDRGDVYRGTDGRWLEWCRGCERAFWTPAENAGTGAVIFCPGCNYV